MKITKAAFSNAVAYELKSLQYTSFYAAADTSTVDVTLTITRTNGTKLTLVSKRGVTLNGTTLGFCTCGTARTVSTVSRPPAMTGSCPSREERRHDEADRQARHLQDHVLLESCRRRTRRGHREGLHAARLGELLHLGDDDGAGTDAMYVEVTDPYTYRVTAYPVVQQGRSPERDHAAEQHHWTQITTRSIHTFRCAGNTAYPMSYAFTVIQ